jgi:hypothetical protein
MTNMNSMNNLPTESTNKSKPQIWRQEINLFNHKLNMETSGTHKKWMIKISDSYKYFKAIRPQMIATKSPLILKLFIFGEIGTWAYSNFIKGQNAYLDEVILSNPIYHLIKKDSAADYLVNIGIYSYIGKFMYIRNKFSFYSLFFFGSVLSLPLDKVNSYAKKYFDKNLNIEEFNLFNPSCNLLPKMIVSTSIMQYLNYFFSNNRFMLKEGFTLDKKALVMFIWVYTFSKISQFISNFTTESIK